MTTYNEGNSLRIYYSGVAYPSHYIDCWCSRWDEGSYDITIETFLPSGARDELFKHILPGAIREYDNVLGWVINLDETYSKSSNTLIFEPIHGYGLSSLRSKKVALVKNASDTFITPDRFGIKLECKWKRDWSDWS